MFCSKCGKENENYASTCSACGCPLRATEPVTGKPWPDGIINLLLFLSGILPIIGIIAGLVGIFRPSVRPQGVALLMAGIATAVMYVLATPVGGIIFGVGFALLLILMPQKNCPDCGTALPKFRAPQQNVLRGGWICPNCQSEIDRKGNLTKSGTGGNNEKKSIEQKVDPLPRKRGIRLFWGWFLTIPGVLMIILLLLTYFFPSKASSGEVSELTLENMLWAGGFFMIFFLAPGLFLLSRAKKLSI
jgi:hypothetical protein